MTQTNEPPEKPGRFRLRKLERLARVIAKYRPYSFEVSVSRKAYKELAQPEGPHDLRHAYFPCFVGVLYALAETLSEEGLSGPVDLIFDMQGNVGTSAALWYTSLKLRDPNLAVVLGGPPIFRDDKQVLPLQAADMLAWHVRRLSEPGDHAEHKHIAGLICTKHRVLEIPDETVKRWGETFSEVPGIERVKWRRGATAREFSERFDSLSPTEATSYLKWLNRRAKWLLLVADIRRFARRFLRW